MLQGDLFKEAWERAPFFSREELSLRLNDDNEWFVKDWIHRNLDNDIRNWSYRKLREVASLHNVPGYSRMNKDQLTEALAKRCVRPLPISKS